MMKLQDFAESKGVTDRAIQKHLKNHEKELQGHFERKGPNGTWLDDYACAFISDLMRSNPVVMVDDRVDGLMAKIEELQKKLDDKEEMLERKDLLIEKLQQRVEDKELQLEEKRDLLLQIEDQTNKKIQAAEEKAEKETKILEGFIQDAKTEIEILTEEKRKETTRADQLQAELDRERSKTFFQKLFGK